ncbi:MAG: M1 family peptidase, partial [Planctomycetota bacterium]
MTRRVGAFSRVPALACLFLLTFGADDTTTEAELPKRSARIVDYSIDARLVPETQSVEGRQTLTWRNTSSAAVDRLWFHLYLNAFKDEKSTFMRESSGSHRRQHADKEHPGSIEIGSMKISGSEQELWTDDTRSWEAPDDGNEHDRTVAAVQLPKAVGPGDSITLEIAFTSKLPRVFARTGWAGDPGAPETLFFMVAQWFPKIGVLEELEPGKPAFNCHQFHRSTEFYADYGTY